MKNIQFFLLVLVLPTIISCNNGTNRKTNNSQKIVVSQLEEYDSLLVKRLYKEFLIKQSRLNIITYNVQRIDTFAQGSVWNNTGKATLERNDQDTLFRFSFYGKRNDLPRENFYREYIHYQVFQESKTYRIETDGGTHILGAPGGQMVVVDLLNPDTAAANISLQNKDDESFIIKTIKRNDGYITTKILTINKTTLIPTKVSNTVINPDLGAKQSTTFLISNVLINDQVKSNELYNLDFLSNYKQDAITEDRSADVLIGKKVPEVMLKTFNKGTINIRSFESKVLLLDFWELWCGPCIQSMPKVQAMEKTYSSKGLITIGIATDNFDKAIKYTEKEGLRFLLVEGNTKMKSIFKVNSVPRYVLIDRNGLVNSIFYGYSDEIEKNIKSLISN